MCSSKKGDVLTSAQEVQHWMYFRSERYRALFRGTASKAGFKIASESHAEGERPFGISVSRSQPVDQEHITQSRTTQSISCPERLLFTPVRCVLFVSFT